MNQSPIEDPKRNNSGRGPSMKVDKNHAGSVQSISAERSLNTDSDTTMSDTNDTTHGRIVTDDTTIKTMFNGSHDDPMSVTVGPLTMDFARVRDEYNLEGECTLVNEHGEARGALDVSKDVLENHFRKLMWEHYTDDGRHTDDMGRVVTEVSDE